MKFTALIPCLTLAAAFLFAAAGCSHADSEPQTAETAILRLKIRLSDIDYGSRATGDGYEPDKGPADDGEKIHTVRIIIADGAGTVEHNTLWDLEAAPDIVASGGDFPVRANDTKTIVLIANEKDAIVATPGGTPQSATDYFTSAANAAVGNRLNPGALRRLLFYRTDNLDGYNLRKPLLMTAIHTGVRIGGASVYRRDFTIHRAAAKYTYRITNNDAVNSHTVDQVHINHVAARQYVFPDYDYTDTDQMFYSAYRTPDNTGSVLSVNTAKVIAPKETVELDAIYLPEGHTVADGDSYATALTIDGKTTEWSDLRWYMPQTPSQSILMTDLPRNTHVIVNVQLSRYNIKIFYTVCPWVISSVDIPEFN